MASSMPLQPGHLKALQKRLFRGEKSNQNKTTTQQLAPLAFPCKIHYDSRQQKAVTGRTIPLGFPNPSRLAPRDQTVAQDHIMSQTRGEKMLWSAKVPG